jgi:hypothetical protein
MLLIPWVFLKSIYFPTNALWDTIYVTRVKATTSLSTQVASSGSYYNKDVQANLPMYVLFSYKLYFICCFRVVYMVSVYKQRVLLHTIDPLSSFYTVWCVDCQVVYCTNYQQYLHRQVAQTSHGISGQDQLIICIHYPYKQLWNNKLSDYSLQDIRTLIPKVDNCWGNLLLLSKHCKLLARSILYIVCILCNVTTNILIKFITVNKT